MNTHELAQALRQRQYDLGLVDKYIVDSLSDDDIIDSYITCSHCGEKQVDVQNLKRAIQLAHNADQFLELCSKFANARYKRKHSQLQEQFPRKVGSTRRWVARSKRINRDTT